MRALILRLKLPDARANMPLLVVAMTSLPPGDKEESASGVKQ